MSGSGDEWKQGDVPVLGREGFILFFFVAGIGGAVGLFIYSTGMMKRSASKTMKTLIGDEGMKKAASVKADAKAAKEAVRNPQNSGNPGSTKPSQAGAKEGKEPTQGSEEEKGREPDGRL